jgi:hypothetical protein
MTLRHNVREEKEQFGDTNICESRNHLLEFSEYIVDNTVSQSDINHTGARIVVRYELYYIYLHLLIHG